MRDRIGVRSTIATAMRTFAADIFSKISTELLQTPIRKPEDGVFHILRFVPCIALQGVNRG